MNRKSVFSSMILSILSLLAVGSSNGSAKPLLRPGVHWNESRRYIDPLSHLPVIQLTTQGEYNQGPVVHYGKAFPGGKNEIVFCTSRNGKSGVMLGNLETGEIKVLFAGPDRPKNYSQLLADKKTFHEVLKHYWSKMFLGDNVSASLHHRTIAVIQKPQENLLLINADTGNVKTVLSGWQHPTWKLGNPSFSNDGSAVAVCAAGLAKPSAKGSPLEYVKYNLKTGKLTTLYKTSWGQSHIYSHPILPNLWVAKIGMPSFYERNPLKKKAILQRPDCFFLNEKTGRLTGIIPRNPNKNIAHSAWTGDGKILVYHGSAANGGMFVGAIAINGKVIWEYVKKDWDHKVSGWNHIAADSIAHHIIDDGMMVPNQISLLDYSQSGNSGKPNVIPLAQWKNQWLPGQTSHPHPAVSPDGRFVVFYGCRNKKTHIYAIDISKIRAQLSKLPQKRIKK